MSEAGLPLEIERKFLIALPDAALLGEKSVKRLAIAQIRYVKDPLEYRRLLKELEIADRKSTRLNSSHAT